MPRLPLIVCILVFVVGQVGASLVFRVTAMKQGSDALLWFIGGNCLGFLCPVALTLALRGANPNVVYALCFGSAFCVLQFGSWMLFREPITLLQWAGIGLVAVGIVLLQVKA